MKIPSIINQAELARKMFPNNKSAPTCLADKISGRQRKKMTDKDWSKVKQVIQDALDELS